MPQVGAATRLERVLGTSGVSLDGIELTTHHHWHIAQIPDKNYHAKVILRLKLAASLASCLLLALVLPAPAQRKGEIVSISSSAAPYRVGERLTYNVSFSNFISAAHVDFQVVTRGTFFGREGIQLRSHIQTTGVVNVALFAINNDYITYVDPQTGLPFRSQQVVRQASRASDTSQDFTQPASTAAIPSESSLANGTHDFLSAIYRLRALPLSEGSTYRFSVRVDNTDYQAELKVTGRQAVNTNVGSYNALVSQVRITNDSTANNYRLRIFFSDDERHVPVLMTARHRAGEIRAELAGLEFVTPPTQQQPGLIANKPLTAPTDPGVVPNDNGLTRPSADNGNGDGHLDSLPFKVGEQLNYQVFLGNLAQPVGNANFHFRSRARYFDHDGYLFVASAQTTNAAQRLFSANDRITSYVDQKSLLPFRTELNLVEGSKRLTQILNVNQDYGAATSDKGEKIEIPVGTHDYISFFYMLRTFNLTPPRKSAISILVNNKTKTLFVTALKRETIKLGSQSIPAIQLSLTTDDSPNDKFQLRAWISDDKRRLPLRLTAVTEIGVVRADLAIIPVTSQ